MAVRGPTNKSAVKEKECRHRYIGKHFLHLGVSFSAVFIRHQRWNHFLDDRFPELFSLFFLLLWAESNPQALHLLFASIAGEIYEFHIHSTRTHTHPREHSSADDELADLKNPVVWRRLHLNGGHRQMTDDPADATLGLLPATDLFTVQHIPDGRLDRLKG